MTMKQTVERSFVLALQTLSFTLKDSPAVLSCPFLFFQGCSEVVLCG